MGLSIAIKKAFEGLIEVSNYFENETADQEELNREELNMFEDLISECLYLCEDIAEAREAFVDKQIDNILHNERLMRRAAKRLNK